MGRIKGLLEVSNISIVNDLYFFLAQYQSGDYMNIQVDVYNDQRNIGSGITSLLNHWLLITIVLIVFLPKWILKLSRLESSSHLDMKKISMIMLIAATSSLFGQPLFTASYFLFFFSCVLYPLTLYLVKPGPNTRNAYS